MACIVRDQVLHPEDVVRWMISYQSWRCFATRSGVVVSVAGDASIKNIAYKINYWIQCSGIIPDLWPIGWNIVSSIKFCFNLKLLNFVFSCESNSSIQHDSSLSKKPVISQLKAFRPCLIITQRSPTENIKISNIFCLMLVFNLWLILSIIRWYQSKFQLKKTIPI